MAIDLNRECFDELCKFSGWEPHQAQLEVLDAFFSGCRFLAEVFGRQTGKTVVNAHIIRYAMTQRNKLIWAMAPTYDLCGRMWDFLEPIAREAFGDQVTFRYSKPAMMTLPWGTRVEFRSLDNADSNVGAGVDMIVWDEAALTKNGGTIWKRQLRATLAFKLGQCLCPTTPRGHNWFYDLVQTDEWWMKQFPSYCNPHLPASELDSMKRELDEMSYRQEVLAEFVAFAGMVYNMFEMNVHVIEDDEAEDITEHWTTSIACDPGLNNTLIQLIKHNPVTGEDIVMRDTKLQNKNFDDALDVINSWEPPERYEALICDIAGKARGHQTKESFMSWMRDRGRNFQNTSIKNIPTGITMVRGRLKNCNGEVRLKFARSAIHTIKMMLNYHFPEGSRIEDNEPYKDGIYDHAGDALRYYITWRYRPVSRAVKH